MDEGDLLKQRVRLLRLYDLYGPLLTERQRRIYEMHDLDDYSLSEISEDLSISRQGVSDQLQRVRDRLEEMERLLGLEKRLNRIADIVEQMMLLSADKNKLKQLCNQVLGVCRGGAEDRV